MREKEYREWVLAEFDRQQSAGLLPPELQAPTRKDLRDHCIKISRERYEKRDEPLLKSFYGARNNQAEYLIAIQNADAEDFRNLHNFLNSRKGTAFINICMLAWMIAFEPRPYREDLKPPPPPITKPGKPVIDKDPEIPSPPPPRSKMHWVYAATIALVCLVAYYLLSRPQLTGNEGCMLWTGEQYQPISCTYKPAKGGITAVPLDTGVLKHLKKIMKDDTLTAVSIGKVWCVKINGQYEYYTDSAAHPVYPEKHLRPLTHYIMNNHPPSRP